MAAPHLAGLFLLSIILFESATSQSQGYLKAGFFVPESKSLATFYICTLYLISILNIIPVISYLESWTFLSFLFFLL
jgi:hypothetical protein